MKTAYRFDSNVLLIIHSYSSRVGSALVRVEIARRMKASASINEWLSPGSSAKRMMHRRLDSASFSFSNDWATREFRGRGRWRGSIVHLGTEHRAGDRTACKYLTSKDLAAQGEGPFQGRFAETS